MTLSVIDKHFSLLGQPAHVWAISAVHGDLERLMLVHDALYDRIAPGDRVVYLGNIIGHGAHSTACIDEILDFKRRVLALPGMQESDIVCLRGQQEELLHKVQEIQLAHLPDEVLRWMLSNGLGPTLQSYGINPEDGLTACRSGLMVLTRWAQSIRSAIISRGHNVFLTDCMRAAYTAKQSPCPVLFVHAGIDSSRPIHDQGDSFWWESGGFENLQSAYLPFQKIVRGFDPRGGGLKLNCITATLDAGCGFGGDLVCAAFSASGRVVELLEA